MAFNFGAPANNPFGANNNQQQQQQPPAGGGGLFGGGGAFGQPAAGQATSLFGGAPQQQQQQTGGLFGGAQQQPPQQGGGLFGGAAAGGGGAAGGTGGGGLFGGGGAFGQQNNTNNAAGGANAFGPRPTFGAAGTGLFGGNAAATNNPFGGNTANTSGFGTQNNTGFGASGSTGGLFGQNNAIKPPTLGTGFGSNNNLAAGGSGLFNTQKPAFGSTNTLAQSNTLQNIAGQAGQQQGGHAQGVPPNGSATAMYDPAKETEGNAQNQVKCVYHSITVMKPFQGANFEELRLKDYETGRRQPPVQVVPQANQGFGATNTFGGFGTQAQQPQQNNGFGQPAAAPAPTFGGFGAPAANTGGLFGQQPAAANGFGQTNQPAPSLFGQPAQQQQPQGGLFGTQQQQPQPTAGLFGTPAAPAGGNMFAGGSQNQNAAAPAFGGGLFGAAKPAAAAPSTFNFGTQAAAPAAQNANPFGAQQNAQAAPAAQTGFGGFGQQPAAPPAPAFGFGQPQQPQPAANLFGQPQNTQQPQQGGLFGGVNNGANKPTTNLFGGAPAPSNPFGAPGPAPPAFGAAPAAQAPAPGLFGNAAAPAPNGGLFGTNNNNQPQQGGQQAQQSQGSGGLFGGGFGGGAPNQLFGTGTNFGQQTAPVANTGTNQAGNAFGGTNGLFGAQGSNAGAAPVGGIAFGGGNGGIFGQQPQQAQGAQGSNAFNPTAQTNGGLFGPPQAQIQRPFGTNNSAGQQQQPSSITININSADPYGANTLFPSNPAFNPVTVAKVPAPLSSSLRGTPPPAPRQPARIRQSTQNLFNSQNGSSSVLGNSGRGSPGGLFDNPPNRNNEMHFSPRPAIKKLVIQNPVNSRNLASSAIRNNFANGRSPAPAEKATNNGSSETAAVETPTRASGTASSQKLDPSTSTRRDDGDKVNFSELEEGDYWSSPTLNTLSNYGRKELEAVSNFCVGRKGHGKVTFLRPVDLTRENSLSDILGGTIEILTATLEVYKGESPPPGEGLNQPARIELEGCWPKSRSTGDPIKDPANPTFTKWIASLERKTEAHFVSYDRATGTWTFEVDHFTLYGVELLVDDQEDDEAMQESDAGMVVEESEEESESETDSPAKDSENDDDMSEESEYVEAATPKASRSNGYQRARAGFGEAEVEKPEMFDDPVERSTFGAVKKSRERAQQMYLAHPFTLPPRKYVKIAMQTSVLNGQESNFRDVGGAFGCSYRACLGSTMMACPTDADVRLSTITSIDLTKARSMVALQREHSDIHVMNGVPFISPARDLRFKDFAALFASDKGREAQCWRLGHALFDEVDLPMAPEGLTDAPVAGLARKAAFSRWLEDCVGPTVEHEAYQVEAGPKTVFSFLSGHRIESAVESSVKSGDLRLGLLVSQIGGGEFFKASMAEQLQGWRDQEVDQHISTDVMRIYAVLAGAVSSVPSSKNTRNGQSKDLQVDEDLGWERALGLHLWYGTAFEDLLPRVLGSYKQRLADHPFSKRPFLPLSNGLEVKDALYAMIELFCNPQTGLEELMDPRTRECPVTDVSFSWHLFMLLTTVLGVGAEATDDNKGIGTKLTVDYAAQLESGGAWIEAVFVLLHLKESHVRVKAVKELLFRQPEGSFAEQHAKEMLLESLKIPMVWLAEAEANVLRDQGQVFAEFASCLAAGLFDRGHTILIQDLVPELVLHHDGEKAKELLNELENEHVAEWAVGGQIVSDYVSCHQEGPELRKAYSANAIPDAVELERLHNYDQTLVKINDSLPGLFNHSKEKPMGLKQKAALRQMMSDVQGMMAGLASDLGVASGSVPDALPEADKLALIQNAARRSFFERLDVACEV